MRALAFFAIPLLAAGPGASVVQLGRGFGSDPLPSYDRGYLFFLGRNGVVEVYKPDGTRAFDAAVVDPQGKPTSVTSAAADGDRALAVAAGYSSPRGYQGMIAVLDPGGKQQRILLTGNYVPSHICFDAGGSLWTFGWQRDASDNSIPDRLDYPMVRRFAPNGKQTGAFLPRSAFAPGPDPFSPSLGLWQARAARNRVGALAFVGRGDRAAEWVELDLEGNLAGSWKLPSDTGAGYAYTSGGRLFANPLNGGRRALVELDRAAKNWVPARLATRVDEELGLLLGADGDRLVFADPGGFRLFSVAAR